MSKVRDSFWIWGHHAGSHDTGYDINRSSIITPVESAFYLGISNIILVRFHDLPEPPFEQYAVPFSVLDKVVWSIVGAGGRTGDEERRYVLQLASNLPNVTGVIMDDFFRGGDEVAALSTEELQQTRAQLEVDGRRLDLWVVLYTHQFDLPLGDHLALCDKLTLWTWKADDIDDLETNFAKSEELAPDCGKILGCYMWDYGQKKPMPVHRMQQQCEIGLRWLKEARIEGMIFLASCICDLNLEAVEWTREWIASVADEEL